MKNISVCQVTTAHTPLDIRVYNRNAAPLAAAMRRVGVLAAGGENRVTDHGVHLHSYQSMRPVGTKQRVKAAFKAWRAAIRSEYDILVLHDPELLLPLALFGKSGKKVIFDSHEYYLATVRENPGRWRSIMGRLYESIEKRASAKLDGIIAPTPEIRRAFSAVRDGVVLRNYPTMDIFEPFVQVPNEFIAGRFIYSGVMSQRSLYPLADAVRILAERGVRVEVEAFGRFNNADDERRLTDYWREQGIDDRLRCNGYVDRGKLFATAKGCTAGLVLFWPTLNARMSQPNKLFEYMGLGLPVIVSDCPNHASVIAECGCGLVCDSRSGESIAQAMAKLANPTPEVRAMGRRAADACREKYDFSGQIAGLLEFYERIL